MASPLGDVAAAEVAVREWKLRNLAMTRRFARALSERVAPGDLIGLGGALGAGKTTIARAMIQALGSADEEVPSPTFTLVQVYELERLTLWHFDLYRLGRPEDVYELGYEDALADGVSLIEWPERLGTLLPADQLMVEVSAPPGQANGCVRIARLAPFGNWCERLADLHVPA